MTQPRSILHFVTPLKNVSPFDVNMATDAGFDVIVPYSDVDLKEVSGLVQDAIFSRAPEYGAHTAMLIGGREPILAMDMLDAAKHAMVPPHFEISVMADPSGAFTTAAGMIAVVEKHLRAVALNLAGRRVAVFGGTGPVGRIAALIAAQAGAKVSLVGYDGLPRGANRGCDRGAGYLRFLNCPCGPTPRRAGGYDLARLGRRPFSARNSHPSRWSGLHGSGPGRRRSDGRAITSGPCRARPRYRGRRQPRRSTRCQRLISSLEPR